MKNVNATAQGKTLGICIGNYSAYNAGDLIDRWVTLPMAENDLDGILSDMQREAQRLTGEVSEEFYISDYDGVPFGEGHLFGEYADIEHLNVLAHVMAAASYDEDAVAAWLDANPADTLLELANIVAQADELEVYAVPDYGFSSDEANYGYMWAEETGLAKQLEDMNCESYFDYEAYGRDTDDYIGGGYYIPFNANGPDVDAYSWDELVEEYVTEGRAAAA